MKIKNECYPISEALYHLLGGADAGFTPQVLRMPDGSTHWYLKHRTGVVIDPTVNQYRRVPDYTKGKGCGFLTKKLSKRGAIAFSELARTVIQNVIAYREAA